jgi:hypothetical protein
MQPALEPALPASQRRARPAIAPAEDANPIDRADASSFEIDLCLGTLEELDGKTAEERVAELGELPAVLARHLCRHAVVEGVRLPLKTAGDGGRAVGAGD